MDSIKLSSFGPNNVCLNNQNAKKGNFPPISQNALKKHQLRYVTTPTGGMILIFDGYTYSKNGNIRKGGARFACSKMLKNCRAHIHMSHTGDILKAETVHNHEPPSFYITNDGHIIRRYKSWQ